MYRFVTDLFPICRSITGNGVRETLARIQKHVPVDIHEVPSGTRVFDWVIPQEWNIRQAWVKDPSGKKIIDFQESNLHVLNYSTPVQATLRLKELRSEEHTSELQSQSNLVCRLLLEKKKKKKKKKIHQNINQKK